MAFNATTITLRKGLDTLQEIAVQEKAYLGQWNAALAGTIDAQYALNIVANLDRVLATMDTLAALPGMAAYAQQQLGSANYDIAAEYSSMRSALDAVRAWLRTNIPSNAVTIVNGTQTYATYAPAATASLRSLVQSAAATIA